VQAPAKHRFSVNDYYRMAETGVLSPKARVELLDGDITDKPPATPLHAGVVNHLNHIFADASKGRWQTSIRRPLRLDDYSEPEPDVMLLKPAADFYRTRHPGPADVYLLIEVADSSLFTDVNEKLPIYGRSGIGEVWIVNLIDETIEIYRKPHFSGFDSKTVLYPGDQAVPQTFPDVIVDVAELLKR